MANTMSKYGSNTNRPLSEIVGLSTDTKPTDSIEGIKIQNGSSFRELDTGKRFLFDAENTTWNEVSSGGGGGSTLIEKSISANGVYNASDDSADGYSKVTVDVPSGGGDSATRKDVNFYDYDGTIVNSYTTAEFANLSAMPSNPSHDGLTAQGWNWSLADAKAYVADYGKLNIGQMYVTNDGKTRVHINLIDNYTSPTLELYLEANSEVDVDWGDGSTHSTFTSTTANFVNELHPYSTSGDYTIIINVISGSIRLNGNGVPLLKGTDTETNRIYRESLFDIEIGNSVTSIGNNTFDNCSSLSSITIPDGVTSIGQYAFYRCSSLSSITIPDGVTSIGNNAFSGCSSLSSITIPDGVTSIGNNAFQNCFSLLSVIIPDGVTSIGGYAFSGCSSLSSITIPDGVTSIDSYAFNSSSSLLNIYVASAPIPAGSPWGAPNTHVNVVAVRHNNYQSSCTEVTSGTTLTGTVNATVGDLVVATFVIRSNSYSLSEGWSLIGISDVVGTSNQRTGLAYKIATSTTESLTVTQDSPGRIYTNLVAITGASIGTFSGFTTNNTGNSITVNKPNGLVVWAVSARSWGNAPIIPWVISPNDNITSISLSSTAPRLLNALDQSNNDTITFSAQPYSETAPSDIAAASLTITGIDNFWYYAD